MASKGTYIPELSTWRFVFIMMIFLHHVKLFPSGGAIGVAFFFILGGFTLTLGYADKVKESSFDYGRYLKRRLIKFYPLHWLVLFLFVPLDLLCGVPVSVKTFVPNFLLLQSFIPVKEIFYSFNSPSWYLCNTVFFAVLFPFIYGLLVKLKRWQWAGVILLYVVLITVQCVTPDQYRLSIIYINPFIRLFDFVIGVLMAMIYKKVVQEDQLIHRFKEHIVLVWVIVALSLTELLSIPLWAHSLSGKAYLLWPPIIILIMSTTVISITSNNNSILRNKVLVSLGNVSFAFYMIHSLVINIVQVLASKVNLENLWIVISVDLVLTIVGSYMVTYYFVNPTTKWLSSKLIKKTI